MSLQHTEPQKVDRLWRFLPCLAACRCANRPNSTSLVLVGSRVRPNFPSRLHKASWTRRASSRYWKHESNESRSGTGTVTEATKVRLEAVPYLPGTDGSNPFPSSEESRANLTRLLAVLAAGLLLTITTPPFVAAGAGHRACQRAAHPVAALQQGRTPQCEPAQNRDPDPARVTDLIRRQKSAERRVQIGADRDPSKTLNIGIESTW
jgi:hypothetical protein